MEHNLMQPRQDRQADVMEAYQMHDHEIWTNTVLALGMNLRPVGELFAQDMQIANTGGELMPPGPGKMSEHEHGAARSTWMTASISAIQFVAWQTGLPFGEVAERWIASLTLGVQKLNRDNN